MATKLDKPLKREITIDGQPFIVVLSNDGLKLVGKGRRKGLELRWSDVVSGEAALATALAASLKQSLHLEPARTSSKRTIRSGTPSAARLHLVKGGHAHGGRQGKRRKAGTGQH